VVEHVTPVTEHVDDDAAVVLLTVIPRWPLRQNGVALKDPIAELAAHAEQAAEEALLAERAVFHEAGEPEFVLHDAVFHAGLLREFVEFVGFRGGDGGGFLAVDVFAGGDALGDTVETAAGGLGVEVNGVGLVGERGVEIRGPLYAFVHGRELLELRFVAADEHERRDDALAVAELDAALLEDAEK
jgi:hypothetical protein